MIILFLILFFIIFIYFLCRSNKLEPYINLNIYPSRLFFMRKFAKLKNGKIVSLDIKPIEPTMNESQCNIRLCPARFADKMTCYECF